MRHLLVTNDFPPKLGGIQSYLWELWRRLPPDDTVVLTTPFVGSGRWDAEQPFRIERTRQRVLLPTRSTVRRIDRLAAEVDASVVLLDPALPLGLVGPHLERPYGVVVHGAEVTVPGRIPIARSILRHALSAPRLVVAAGGYPATEAARAAGRALPAVIVPPGVDTERFRPLDPAQRNAARAALGLPKAGDLVVSVSRLVPRKGMDVLIEAVAGLACRHRNLHLAIGGQGRDRRRLERIATRTGAPVTFLDRVPDAMLPALYGSADIFAMLCRNRWLGLEQEGFGIVFLEAASCQVPQIAGLSGGSAEAVEHGRTGLVVDRPRSVGATRAALSRLIEHPEQRAELGRAARTRAERHFTYDELACRLASAIDAIAEDPAA